MKADPNKLSKQEVQRRIETNWEAIKRLQASTEGTPPPTWEKFISGKLWNKWSYPDKGAYEVWMEQRKMLISLDK